jgi:hypothetical protein
MGIEPIAGHGEATLSCFEAERKVGRSAFFGFVVLFQSYYDFSFGMSFFKITDRFSYFA